MMFQNVITEATFVFNMKSLHWLEKYLNMAAHLEKSLKMNAALKCVGESQRPFKVLESNNFLYYMPSTFLT